MYPAVVDSVPVWIVNGVLLGLGLSVLVAVLFYVLVRQFPSDRSAEDHRQRGDERRRDEIRQYLDTIGERYTENQVVEGQQVDFYLPERDVAITFDARAYYHIGRTGTAAVLVEHEVPGLALGPRLPFETPEIDFGDENASEVDPQEAAFAVLGLPAGASVEEIQRAYRERVKEVHPDQGGDEDEFKRVRDAYATAKRHAG